MTYGQDSWRGAILRAIAFHCFDMVVRSCLVFEVLDLCVVPSNEICLLLTDFIARANTSTCMNESSNATKKILRKCAKVSLSG